MPIRWRARRDLDRRLESLRSRLVRLAWAWTGDRALAEDLVQETLARAVRARRTLRDPSRMDAWTISILHRVHLDYLKAACRREAPVDLAEDRTWHVVDAMTVQETPESSALVRERQRSVRDAIASLPISQRQVIALVDLEEMSYADCAEILEIPVGTVMSRLNRGRAALRGLLVDAEGPQVRGSAPLRVVR